MMAKKPEDRPQSMDEVVELIDAALADMHRRQPVSDAAEQAKQMAELTPSGTFPPPAAPAKRRWRDWVVLLTMVSCVARC